MASGSPCESALVSKFFYLIPLDNDEVGVELANAWMEVMQKAVRKFCYRR